MAEGIKTCTRFHSNVGFNTRRNARHNIHTCPHSLISNRSTDWSSESLSFNQQPGIEFPLEFPDTNISRGLY